MPRIFEAYPILRDTSNAPPPYSEPSLPATLAQPLITPTPRSSTPLFTPDPYLWKNYRPVDDWSDIPAGKKAISQLCRYLNEILAFTFEVDMTPFNAALGQPDDTKTSLSSAKNPSLLALARLTRSMRPQVDQPAWITIPDEDCKMVVEAVSKPVKLPKLPDGFVLRLLAIYTDHLCDPAKDHNASGTTLTLSSRNIARCGVFRCALEAIVQSHVDVVVLIALDEEV